MFRTIVKTAPSLFACGHGNERGILRMAQSGSRSFSGRRKDAGAFLLQVRFSKLPFCLFPDRQEVARKVFLSYGRFKTFSFETNVSMLLLS